MGDPVPGTSQTSSPPRKKPKHMPAQMTENEKKIAINVYKYVEKNTSTYPYKKDILQIVSEIMGTSESTIDNLIRFYEKTKTTPKSKVRTANRAKIAVLDDFTLSAIRRKIHQFYFDGTLPTIVKVMTAINEDNSLPTMSKSSIYKLMKQLKFTYIKRTRKSILLDRPDLQIWRQNYLLRISDFRKQNKKVFYLDETWLNEGHTSSYVWVDNDIQSSKDAFLRGLSTGLKNPQKGKRLIITHIGNEDGFIDGAEWVFEAKKESGDYHSEMDAHNYEKWYEKIVEKIPHGAVIVMDNAPYHSRQTELVPNMSWRKEAIQTWLRNKSIRFENNEIKAQLLAKIQKEKYKKYYIDEISKSKGITVLRLPPYHCELNPIELIWAQVKSYVGRNNKYFKMTDVKNLLTESLARIGKEQWGKCVAHVIKVEGEMKKLDGLIDNTTDRITEPFVINVDDTDSESYSYSNSDESNKEN